MSVILKTDSSDFGGAKGWLYFWTFGCWSLVYKILSSAAFAWHHNAYHESSTAEPISTPNKATTAQLRCSATVSAASPVNGEGVGVLGLTDVLDAFPNPPMGLQSS